ncbi:HEAT repeat domain-containing protein [Anabaena sp. CCY 9910]|uniref:HEAT repeat domain-containing protein n=1 Tax=Anabaena sp. CCY 9910 TaxID=3103870 RepID=UPI0039E1572A
MPLGLVERKKPPRIKEDVSPEKGSELYHETEITQTFEHQQFLEQVLRDRQSPKSQGKRIAIIGEPGAGKTTLLQQTAKWVSKKIEQSVVIWVSLADLRSRDLETYLLEVWLKAVARTAGQAEASTQVKDDFVAQFNQGLVWLVLDGVDEMQSTLGNPLEEIGQQIRQGGLLQQSRIVLSCRLNLWDGGSNALDSFDNYRTLEFSYPQQVEEYICKWFGSQSPAQMHTGEQLCVALREPGKERIRDLVKNPLRLMLLCLNWHSGEGNLPQTKAGLYEQFVSYFYEWKKDRFETTREQRRQLNAALAEMAQKAIDKEATRFWLRQEFVCEYLGHPDDTDSLFAIALQLGWLNKVGVEAKHHTRAVYAFFHPTFQEYFAALSIDDWHYFLNHIPENPSHADANYRIFETQWREVLLLWLGREDISKEQKENLIQSLVQFEDRCNDFYWDKAVFIAAAGISEFRNCTYEQKIIEQLVLWAFGYFDIQRQEWLEALNPLREEARKALLETNSSKAVNEIINFIQNNPDELYSRYNAIQVLGEIGSGSPEVEQMLADLLCNSQDERTIVQAAATLTKILPSHQAAFYTLINSIENDKDYNIPEYAAKILGEIQVNFSETIYMLIDLIGKYKIAKRNNHSEIKNYNANIERVGFSNITREEKICGLIIQVLGNIGVDNLEVINILLQLLNQSESKYVRAKAVESLGKIGNGNKIVIDTLIDILNKSQDWNLRSISANSLGEVAKGCPEAISALIYLMDNYKHYDNFNKASKSLIKIIDFNSNSIEIIIDKFISILQLDNHPYIVIDIVNCLGEIANGTRNHKAKNALLKLLNSNISNNTRYFVAKNLGKIDSNNRDAIDALEDILNNSQESYWQRCVSAIALEEIKHSNSQALAVLVNKIFDTQNSLELLYTDESQSFMGYSIIAQPDEVSWLINFLSIGRNKTQIKSVVSKLKLLLNNKIRETDFKRWKICYQILWFCSQNLSYQNFYTVWNSR